MSGEGTSHDVPAAGDTADRVERTTEIFGDRRAVAGPLLGPYV